MRTPKKSAKCLNRGAELLVRDIRSTFDEAQHPGNQNAADRTSPHRSSVEPDA